MNDVHPGIIIVEADNETPPPLPPKIAELELIVNDLEVPSRPPKMKKLNGTDSDTLCDQTSVFFFQLAYCIHTYIAYNHVIITQI